jgi:hypothetical protein
MPITATDVRVALLKVWGEQTCQNPDDWPEVQKRLLARNDADRTSYKERLDAAAAILAEAFSAASPLADPVDCVFRAFSPLDAEHRRQLADLLLAHRAPPGPLSLHDDTPPPDA